ncbi:three component ABC system middle component [Nocardiopsis synnemataformans]|uniref:three component ABC system middle component n=1 Tax=Nocardiopsis synnemataformans TaxID=61305 RepID=UPI003EB9EFD0
MTSWAKRSPIAAVMVNPALIATILAAAADGHYKENKQGMPWSLSFVVVPMVLHLPTRRALPNSTRTHLSAWTAKNPVMRSGFPARAQELVGPVKEGTRFGLAHGALKFVGEGRLRSAYRKPRGFQTPEELDRILRKANLVGRWLAKVDSPVTVFAVLGVAP